MCEAGNKAPDDSKSGKNCEGDGSPEQACFICALGECVFPENTCDASPVTTEVKLQSSPLSGFVTEGVRRVGSFPYLKTENIDLVLNTTRKTGEECCLSCTKYRDPVEYVEKSGTLELSGDAVAIVPGTGILLPELKKTFLGGRVKVEGELAFGLGGRGKVSLKGDFISKESECLDSDCFSGGVTGNVGVKVGVIGKLAGRVARCNVRSSNQCTILVGAEANINTTFNIGGTLIGRWYSESCPNDSCFNFRMDPIQFEAQASLKINISRFVSVEWQVKELVDLHDGINNEGCN